MKILELFRNKVLECMKAAEDDPDDACIEEKRIIDDNHCHAIKDVSNESLSNESFFFVADEKQCRIKSEYQDYHISVRFSNIEYTMTRITKDQMSSDNRCQGKCVKKDVNLENETDWHSSDTPKLSSNITKEENNLSKDDAENGCNYNAVYTRESSASIGYSKAVFESRSLGLMPSENSECLESLQNSSLLGDPKPCLNESYGSEFDKDEIATEKLDVNSGEIPASGISDADSTIWLTESRMLTRSSTQTDLTSFNIPVHGTDENVRENTNLFRNLHWSAESGLQSCSNLQIDMETVERLPHSFAYASHNSKSELSPVSASLNAVNIESTKNSLSMCRDAVCLDSIRQLCRYTNFSSDFSVFTGTLDSFSSLSLQREKSVSLLSLGPRQSLSLYSLQSNLHQQELDQAAPSNCMCSCNERSRLSASFRKTDEKDGAEKGTSKGAEKNIESRESEIGPCGENGTNKIDGREKTKPLDNDSISAGDANAFVDSSKKNCYQSEHENGIHMAAKPHSVDEVPFLINKATEEMQEDTVKIKSKESGDTSQQMGIQRKQITSRATDNVYDLFILKILKLVYFLNYCQGNDQERLDGEDKHYADLCKLYMEREKEEINCDELSNEKIWLSSTGNKKCFPTAIPRECPNDGKYIIVPFSRAMHYVDWKMSSYMIAHKNEKMDKTSLHYCLNKMKEESIVYFTACENLFDPRAIFWLQFLDDDSDKYHNKFRYLLQRFCPWIVTIPISAITLDRVENDCFCIHDPFKYTSLLRTEVKYSVKNEESHFLCFPPLSPANSVNNQKPVDAQDNNDPCNCALALVERNFTHSKRSKPKLPRDSKKSDSKCGTNCVPPKPHVSKIPNDNRISKTLTQYLKSRKYSKHGVKKTLPTLMKNKLFKEKRTKDNRLPRSVNSMMADSANGQEVMNSMNPNPAMKPMISTSDSCVLILELRSHSNERKKLFKHQLELNDSRKEEIRRHLVRFYKKYESTKHGRSVSLSLVSMEKIDSLSLPEMVFKFQSISKGLGFLRRYLRISKDFTISSIDVLFPLQQANQQPQEGLESVLQPLDDETRAESEDHMRSEWLRVTTFQTFPSDVGISSVKLAKNGFYYTGQNKETKCHFCSKTYNDWTSTSDIEAIHRQISPDCPFINGRETNNVPIHTSSNPSANQEGIFGNLQGGVIERLRISEETVHEETVGAETVGASISSLTLSQDQIEQLPPSLPTPDRPEGKPPPTQALLTEARETDKESSLQKPVSPQAPSKSKLKREKKKRKKEEQTRIKGEPGSSQATSGGLVISEVPDKQEEELSSLSESISVPPGLVVEEVQPSPGANPNTQEEATSVGGASGVTPHSSQVTESKSLNSGVSRSSNESSERSLPWQNSTNHPNPPQGGATAKAKSSGPNEGRAGPDRQPQGGSSQPAPSRGGANPPAPTPAERLAQLDPLGINFDKPKYPAYAVYSNRLSSFDGWPSHMAQTPRDMARAGYFYAGYGDYARCFFCGGGLRNWDRSDDPWTEHARWFPRCAFLRNNKGDRYVARIQRIHQEQEAGLEPSFQILAPQERDQDTPLAEALREMGYTNQIIQTAMDQWRRRLRPGRRHPPAMSAAGLLDIIEELEGNTEDRASVPTEQPLTIPGRNTEDRASVHTGQPLTIPGSGNSTAVEESPRPSEENTEDGVVMLQENRTGVLVAQGESRDYGYDQREKQEKQILQEEFLGLTETLVCKICCDKDVAAAFLPCGHLVCCLDCAPAMRKCPLCGEIIKGTVKTYFA